ncbi:MAG TPA: hypothetical protein VG916_08275 [Gemmatimonadaceae bacterium]|nr:hypothetical protein [Gemmatimonadaceae bacterium]
MTGVALPEHMLGADLVWWRTANGARTTATVSWGIYHDFPEAVRLRAMLFGADGSLRTSWDVTPRTDAPTVFDSAADGPWRRFPGEDGILALYACTPGAPGAAARDRYYRLYTLVDWRSADGDLATLHSDQVVRRGRRRLQRFTEIVVLEREGEENALVLLNGEDAQPANALSVTVTNASGERRIATYGVPMAPFTVHRVALAELFARLRAFGGGAPLLVSGTFDSTGLFSRPYVVTTGRRWSAHHAGDVYGWTARPFAAHAIVSGEVNPMAVVCDDDTETCVNILHSHDGHERDTWVDARLYDLDGRLVAERMRWAPARRHGLSRRNVADLLPPGTRAFRGHIALRFALDEKADVPWHVQALLEYRRAGGVARVMAWSDEWNSRVKLARRDASASPAVSRSYYRVWCDADVDTQLSITNAGHEGYDRTAAVRALLVGAEGVVAETTFALAPFATRLADVRALFPDADARLAPTGHGLVIVESASDLANVAFSCHRASGALAAEHFMVWETVHEGEIVPVAGM